MNFKLHEAIQVLSATPHVLDALLGGLDEPWIRSNEGPDTWCAFDVVGHLIHGEMTDWIPRLRIILGEGDKRFVPFDRFAQFRESEGKSLKELLAEFRQLRSGTVAALQATPLTPADYGRTGVHPEFGEVTVSQLLACWVAHDLAHLSQIERVMAKRYAADVGPWKKYLRILH